jgi:hypothetical protein
VARPERFELPTLWFEARCSIQLSYGRTNASVPVRTERFNNREPIETHTSNSRRTATLAPSITLHSTYHAPPNARQGANQRIISATTCRSRSGTSHRS